MLLNYVSERRRTHRRLARCTKLTQFQPVPRIVVCLVRVTNRIVAVAEVKLTLPLGVCYGGILNIDEG